MTTISENLHRLLARQGETIGQLAQRSGVDQRTIKGLLSGATPRPHAKTLHQLAEAFEVAVDEFYQNAGTLEHRQFDQQTNTEVAEVVRAHPELFEGWSRADFDELYSRFGMGGALTAEGALETVRRMNRKREILDKVIVLLESGDSELLAGFVDLLYEKVVIRST
ncbi:MAG TPA: helix-turn-helix transcriptional regulator [Pirellulales bacterium]|nr:helix-turn-helix transcriptional regulator [Pirellulales bacterium]